MNAPFPLTSPTTSDLEAIHEAACDLSDMLFEVWNKVRTPEAFALWSAAHMSEVRAKRDLEDANA